MPCSDADIMASECSEERIRGLDEQLRNHHALDPSVNYAHLCSARRCCSILAWHGSATIIQSATWLGAWQHALHLRCRCRKQY